MSSPTPLKFLMPGWFSVVMGLAGLALAWLTARPTLGDSATGVSLVLGALAVCVFGVLLVLSWLRASRYPAALLEDLRHPVRHGFVGAFPLAVLLLCAQAAELGFRGAWLSGLWALAASGQLWATVWVLKRWLLALPVPAAPPPAAPTALQGLIDGALLSPAAAKPAAVAAPAFWPMVTPVLLIPVVGNVVAPLAGQTLGWSTWSFAQLGVGLLLWPMVLALLLVRRAAQGPLPERLMPAWFITIAPPSVIGLVLVQAHAPTAVVAAFWGAALFFVLWVGTVARQAVSQPFSLTFWALSFPLTAFTALTLKLSVSVASPVLQMVGTLLLALTSLVVFGLCLATVRGLRNGSLLAPEPVAQINPQAA